MKVIKGVKKGLFNYYRTHIINQTVFLEQQLTKKQAKTYNYKQIDYSYCPWSKTLIILNMILARLTQKRVAFSSCKSSILPSSLLINQNKRKTRSGIFENHVKNVFKINLNYFGVKIKIMFIYYILRRSESKELLNRNSIDPFCHSSVSI